MSSLAADVTFDFTFPQCHQATSTPPPAPFYEYDSFDRSNLLEVPYYGGASRAGYGAAHGHARSSSNCSAYSSYSAYSFASTPSEQSYLSAPSVAATPATPAATPARSQIRTHGPLLLPRIRSQDQVDNEDSSNGLLLPAPPLKRARTSPTPSQRQSRTPSLPPRNRRSVSVSSRRSTLGKYSSSGAAASRHTPSHTPSHSLSQSFTLPSHYMTPNHRASTPSSVFEATPPPPSLLCSGLDTSVEGVEGVESVGKFDYDYAFAPYPGTIPAPTPTPAHFLGAAQWEYPEEHFQSQSPSQTREASPLSVESASPPPEQVVSLPLPVPAPLATIAPQTTLVSYLSQQNPAPALVHTISYPLRDPNTKHYWWDVRQVRAWSAFSAASLVALPGADAVLSCNVPLSLLPSAAAVSKRSLHPETESDLHALYTAHYLPRVNAALALSSPRPVQLASKASDHGEYFAADSFGSTSSLGNNTMFGGRPTARVVGLVKSFDRFNTGMRNEGGATNNIKKVEYLRGLAHLHCLMRENSCRYGFILTEIELVVVRNGTEATPLFGQMEVASVPLATHGNSDTDLGAAQLTANLALWGLCMLASDEMAAAAQQSSSSSSSSSGDRDGKPLLCSYATHIGAPAEGTRRKAAERDAWMPPPQLAEKRAAKRARGWVMPEDAVGRKEMGRRGVKY